MSHNTKVTGLSLLKMVEQAKGTGKGSNGGTKKVLNPDTIRARATAVGIEWTVETTLKGRTVAVSYATVCIRSNWYPDTDGSAYRNGSNCAFYLNAEQLVKVGQKSWEATCKEAGVKLTGATLDLLRDVTFACGNGLITK